MDMQAADYRPTIEDLSLRMQELVALDLFIELWRRADLADKMVRVMSSIDGGYCIDAPALIPAGGCRSWEIPDGTGEWLTEQILVDRQ